MCQPSGIGLGHLNCNAKESSSLPWLNLALPGMGLLQRQVLYKEEESSLSVQHLLWMRYKR